MNRILRIMTVLVTVCLLVSLCGCGERTITLDDGCVFVGEVKDKLPNGEGTLTDPMGSEWTGSFINGRLEGYGVYYGYDLVEYEGEFTDGLFNGLGHRIDANGNDYNGMFENGVASGFGRIEWSTGCYYEGGMKDDLMDGMGWMTWPAGDAYFGEWVAGQPNGFGCKVFYDPAIASCVKEDYSTYNKYVGDIVNNAPNGYGIMYFQESGGIYIGNWSDGVREDSHGIYYFEPGSEYLKFEGSFSKSMNAGWIWGQGTMWYANGNVVTGTWESLECVERGASGSSSDEQIRDEAARAAESVLSSEMLASLMENIG